MMGSKYRLDKPDKPEQAFRRGVLLSLKLINDEGLKCFRIGGGG